MAARLVTKIIKAKIIKLDHHDGMAASLMARINQAKIISMTLNGCKFIDQNESG